jgi:hypothetical protein
VIVSGVGLLGGGRRLAGAAGQVASAEVDQEAAIEPVLERDP